MKDWRLSKPRKYNGKRTIVHTHDDGKEYYIIHGKFHTPEGKFVEERWFCHDCAENPPEEMIFILALAGGIDPIFKLDYYSYPFLQKRGKPNETG